MSASDMKTVAAYITIGITVVSILAVQIVNADVRNRDRDSKQDTEITHIRLDVREISANMDNMAGDMSEVKYYMEEQRNVNLKILKLLEKE